MDEPTCAAVPRRSGGHGRPASRPRSAASRPRRTVDVSRCRSPRPALRQHPFRGIQSAVSAASCTPPSVALCVPFSHRAADLARRRALRHPTKLAGFDRNPPFQKSVHSFRPIEGRCGTVPATESPIPPLPRQTHTRVQAPSLAGDPRSGGSLEGIPFQGMFLTSPGDCGAETDQGSVAASAS